MKTTLFTALILSGFVASTAIAQNLSRAEQEVIMEVRDRIVQQQAQSQSVPPLRPATFATDPRTGAPVQIDVSAPNRFDLSFEGGTPAQFIETINKQANMKVNVIIPPEFADEQLPPVSVFDVTLPQIFEAGIAASRVATNMVTGTYVGQPGRAPTAQYVTATHSKGFKTTDPWPSDSSIWYFFSERPARPPVLEFPEPVVVRVYQLSNLLGAYSIEDITTAIKTTWQMLDSKTKPEMKFHAETKLLVAKGTEEQLRMIETVTEQLGRGIIENERASERFPRLPPKPGTNPNP